jgi:multicomponent Na+:H+ antiporter subunit A
MLIAILSGFAGFLIAPVLHQFLRRWTGWLIALLSAALLIYFSSYLVPIAAGEVYTVSYPWVPALNTQLSFLLDGLSLLFVLLITGIGTLIVLYGSGYLAGHAYLGRFYALIMMFMASMIGLVMADNVLVLFVFWELTSISSYLLIGFDHEKPEVRAAALQAFLVTGGGGLALLGGLLMLGLAANSFELSVIVSRADMIQSSTLYVPALILILLGAFTKSAQFPFHFWLPNAMQAPTPISAYLHSATMVKAGVYLLARLHPALSGSSLWLPLVAGTGLVTMLVGAYLALNSIDLKRILAYSTISSLGTMVLLLGLEGSQAVKAAMIFLLAHALYKGALFMVAGIIDHETHTRLVDRLGGLRKIMPITAIVTALASFSLAGLGPVLAFIGKESLFEAVLEVEQFRFIFIPAAVIAGAVSIALAIIVTVRPFFGPLRETPRHPHDPPPVMWFGPALLGITGLVFGIFPNIAARYLVAPAVTAILQEPAKVDLGLWHGLNPALLMSGIAIALGYLAYHGWDVWRRQTQRFERILRWGPETIYGALLAALNIVARRQTRILQSGYLRNYILFVVLATIMLAGFVLVTSRGMHWPEVLTSVYYYEAGLAVLIVIAALTAVSSRSRLGAIAALGVVGYSIALIYLLFGAPDLAMTQFLIESLTVVLFVFAFYHLPRFDQLGPPRPRLLHALVAIITGGIMTALVLSAVQVDLYPSISNYFTESALPLAHGRNIVNVILVDFRGLDTLGEITVLAAAAAGVYALLNYYRKD